MAMQDSNAGNIRERDNLLCTIVKSYINLTPVTIQLACKHYEEIYHSSSHLFNSFTPSLHPQIPQGSSVHSPR